MTKSTLNKVSPQQSKLHCEINDLEKKERKIYEALAALINFINGKKRELKLSVSFSKCKQEILNAVAQLEVTKKYKNTTVEPKFNVKHYERAIMCASDPCYRDMAIQAASKDLNREALAELVTSLHRDCRQISKRTKELTAELRRKQVKTNARNLLHVIEPMVDKDDAGTVAA